MVGGAEHVENHHFLMISENHPDTSRNTPELRWWFLDVPWVFLDRFGDHQVFMIFHDLGSPSLEEGGVRSTLLQFIMGCLGGEGCRTCRES